MRAGKVVLMVVLFAFALLVAIGFSFFECIVLLFYRD